MKLTCNLRDSSSVWTILTNWDNINCKYVGSHLSPGTRATENVYLPRKKELVDVLSIRGLLKEWNRNPTTSAYFKNFFPHNERYRDRQSWAGQIPIILLVFCSTTISIGCHPLGHKIGTPSPCMVVHSRQNGKRSAPSEFFSFTAFWDHHPVISASAYISLAWTMSRMQRYLGKLGILLLWAHWSSVSNGEETTIQRIDPEQAATKQCGLQMLVCLFFFF